jgi:hypothetical protein
MKTKNARDPKNAMHARNAPSQRSLRTQIHHTEAEAPPYFHFLTFAQPLDSS